MKTKTIALLLAASAGLWAQSVGSGISQASGNSGGGTVTNVSAPSSIFSVANPTTTPALTYATGQAANLIFGTDGSGNVGLMNLTAAQLPSAAVTLTGTQTLTNKSISSGQITGLAASATTDTTNASNISSGTLGAARLPSGTQLITQPSSISGLIGWYKSSALALSNGASVSSWTDSSGNSNALTQSTGGSQPTFVTNVFGATPSVRFTNLNSAGTGTNQWMSIPAGAAPNAQSYTVVWIGRLNQTTYGGTNYAAISSFQGAANMLYYLGSSPSLGKISNYNSAATSTVAQSSLTPPSRLHINGLTVSSTLTTFYINDSSQSISVTTPSGVETGGYLNALGNVNDIGSADVVEFMIFNTPLSATQYTTIADYAYATYGIQHSGQVGQIVASGNSITAGRGITNGNNYPNQLSNIIGSGWNVFNLGRDSYTTAQLNTNFATDVTPTYSNTFAQNISILWEIRNDLCGGASQATAYADMVTWAQTAKAAGWRVIAVTPPPTPTSACSGDSTNYETDRQAISNSMVANFVPSGYADAVVDIRQFPTIGAASAYTNTTYYNTDQIHLTAVGQAVLLSALLPAINSIPGLGTTANYNGLVTSDTAPTAAITGTGCSAGTVVAGNASGVWSGTIAAGGTGAACATTLTFSRAAAHGWTCSPLNDQTTPVTGNQSGASTTTAVFSTIAMTSADVLRFSCAPY